ncbi:MAG: hypothetical protein RBG1_1C00001G1771 [candidate division Zixibacteria bacterium RBG-1]|nr:MAG: hypothetical protein RBG1_1C00001G1771 [candidate division Zixibacteria bacterium RBG-1]OGC85371.1 MAG: hypothetical protein A2V73_09165 [candidate division Zixibacteria bacterium RBG_19FT_COMBO_42_43]
MKKIYKSKRFWGAIIAVTFLLVSFYDVNLNELIKTLGRIDLKFLLLALFFEFMIPLAKSLRWKFILDPVKKIPVREIFSLYCLGWMVNVILPALTGQVARSFMLSKKQNLAKASSFASIALEVVFDGLSLLLLMIVVSYMFAFPSWLIRGEYTLAISVSLGLAFLYFLTHNQKLFSKLKDKFPHKVTEKIDQISHSFSQGLQMLKSSKHIVLVTLFSILSWLSQIAVVTFLLLAFDFKIPAWSAVVIIIINALMMMFPLTPGNIGTFQVATILGLSFFNVHKTEALSFGLVLHSLDILPYLFLGSLFLYLRKL